MRHPKAGTGVKVFSLSLSLSPEYSYSLPHSYLPHIIYCLNLTASSQSHHKVHVITKRIKKDDRI